MPKIKICGIRQNKDINIINKYKPDYIGFVFAKSKRKITHQKAKELKEKLNPNIKSVGVFVNAPIEEILQLYNNQTIDMAQLHGNENEEYIKNLKEKTNNKLKIINAIEMQKTTDLTKYEKTKADYLLLDSGKGSGKTFDWQLINKNIEKDFFLAGGLNANNIQEAINEFHPYAVDLSSALETNDYKDENKIKEIMEIINE
ncbi:MAG: phosphoribosylanthranilate isomerase [Methanobrevibacter thaueri]|nr:phosphoribosylanthranilate isomerase [Methanobrevibacter thaueri]